MAEDQFDFRRGTQKVIPVLRLMIEERIVDLEKAFDNIEWNIIFGITKKAIKYNERKVVYNVYMNKIESKEWGSNCSYLTCTLRK